MADLTAEKRLEHALGLAFAQLNRRDRTVAQMEQYLEGKGIDDETLARAVTELIEEGALDDARYAQRFAEDRRLLDQWGSDRIARRLAGLGVERDLIEAAVARHDHHEEQDAALAVLRKRFSQPPADAKERNRMLGVLLRKGYEPELAYDALRAFSRSLAVD